jgi:hypothetical protein
VIFTVQVTVSTASHQNLVSVLCPSTGKNSMFGSVTQMAGATSTRTRTIAVQDKNMLCHVNLRSIVWSLSGLYCYIFVRPTYR